MTNKKKVKNKVLMPMSKKQIKKFKHLIEGKPIRRTKTFNSESVNVINKNYKVFSKYFVSFSYVRKEMVVGGGKTKGFNSVVLNWPNDIQESIDLLNISKQIMDQGFYSQVNIISFQKLGETKYTIDKIKQFI